MNKLRHFFMHLGYHRELYFLPLIAVLLCVASIHFVNYLTGRPVVDDPGVIVGYLYNAVGIALVLALAGFTQELFFGYRAEKKKDGPNPSLSDDVFDAAITLCLILLYSVLIFSLWR